MSTQPNQAKPQAVAAVPPRVAAEREQRRRRADMTPMSRAPLALPTDKMDPAYTYRWIVDNPGRAHQLTKSDDWDPVTYDELGMVAGSPDSNSGTVVERVSDKNTGKKTILLKKRRDYYEQDKAKEQAMLDKTMEALKQGIVPDSNSGRGLTARDGAYTSGHRIDDGRRG